MPAMMRSLSSCFDATRMWRRTERANLEKKPSTRLSQEPCLGVKVNLKRPVVAWRAKSWFLWRCARNDFLMAVPAGLVAIAKWAPGGAVLRRFRVIAAALAANG